MALWGDAVGSTLSIVTARCLLRSKQSVYMPASTFASVLLRPGDLFVDVGAYDGLVSLIAAHAVGSTGHVYSFEPNPEAFAVIESIARAYRLNSIHLENCAVSAAEGTAILYVPQYAPG